MKARLYVDDRCVYYEKALMESGTLSTKCNSVVVLPHKTASYSDGPQAGANEDQIPMCTLRNFPSLIDHCIEWARSKFNDLFVDAFVQANKYTASPATFIAELRAAAAAKGGSSKVAKALPVLRQIAKLCVAYERRDFAVCVEMAYFSFYEFFNHLIARLTHQFPRDCVNKDTKEPFWSGSKRFPNAMECDMNDPQILACVARRSACSRRVFAARTLGPAPAPSSLRCVAPRRAAPHSRAAPSTRSRSTLPGARVPSPSFAARNARSYVTSAANIFAANLTLVPNPDESKNLLPRDSEWRTRSAIEAALERTAPPPLVLGSSKIATEGDAQDEAGDDELDEFNAILATLAASSDALAGVTFACADFEKDQDLNFHIDFIAAASNLRARNYQLEEASRHKCKMIAGKIIPAIATATAAITGLMMLEMFKLVQDKPVTAFRNAYCNLGFGDMLCTLEEPHPPSKAVDEYDPIEMEEVICQPSGFTKWDKLVVDVGAGTLGDVATQLKAVHGLTLTSFSHAASGIEDGKGSGTMLWARDVYGSAELKAKTAARLAMAPRDALIDAHGEEAMLPGRKWLEFEIGVENADEAVIKVPRCIVKWA